MLGNFHGSLTLTFVFEKIPLIIEECEVTFVKEHSASVIHNGMKYAGVPKVARLLITLQFGEHTCSMQVLPMSAYTWLQFCKRQEENHFLCRNTL